MIYAHGCSDSKVEEVIVFSYFSKRFRLNKGFHLGIVHGLGVDDGEHLYIFLGVLLLFKNKNDVLAGGRHFFCSINQIKQCCFGELIDSTIDHDEELGLVYRNIAGQRVNDDFISKALICLLDKQS